MAIYRETWLEINEDALYYNVSQIKQHYANHKTLIAVVKADAYGHGAVMVSRIALKAGAQMLAVATLEEALELRMNKIKAPILVLGHVHVNFLKCAAKHRITLTAHSVSWLKAANQYKGKSVDVHLKLDTGMNRIGLTSRDEIKLALSMIHLSKSMSLKGVFTHMASSETQDETIFKNQINLFKTMLDDIDCKGLLIHLANSSATIKGIDDFTNACRCGILLYGVLPSKDLSTKFTPKPALSWMARLIQVKEVPQGARVSYNGLYETKKPEWIGTIGIGYADGFDRRIEDGLVFIEGNYCPVIGRVCMDQLMVKLPHAMEEGTLVEIIGNHLPIETLSTSEKTIPYHTLCLLTDRLPKVYVKGGSTIVVNRRKTKLKKDRSVKSCSHYKFFLK
jgi:alanine racemase